MLPAIRATRIKTACLVLAASLIGVGMVAAQSLNPSLTFRNNASLKISVKVDKIGYREDIDPGGSQIVPSSKLQNVDPTDTGIVWEAYPADLKSPDQKQPNAKCDGGTIQFDSRGNAVIEVRGSCS